MIINVIGGSGFIGTRLVNRIYNHNDVTIIDKIDSFSYPAITKLANICNFNELLNSVTPDSIIINLAAEHKDDVTPRTLYDQVNVDGAKNICRVARLKNINKIVFTSSVAVYGFARLGTDEHGEINPFNDYGRTKWEAEQVFREWQAEDQQNRTVVIIRPTVVFGERNRGNVYNLLKVLALGKFIMVGNGLNRKSMAYVENIAAFIEYSMHFKPGIYVFNYIDKPDFTMNQLVTLVNKLLGKTQKIKIRLPYSCGLLIGRLLDCVAFVSGKKFPISAIRVKKFCANSVYESNVSSVGFSPPVPLIEAIERTISYEFLDPKTCGPVFYSE